MVVFDDGKARTRDYRRFKIKAVDGVDDYASMKEMLTRRLQTTEPGHRQPRSGRQGRQLGGSTRSGGDRRRQGSPLRRPGGHAPPGPGQIPLCSRPRRTRRYSFPIHLNPLSCPGIPGAVPHAAHPRRSAPVRHQLPPQPALQEQPEIAHRHGHRHGPKRKRMLLRRFGSLQGIKEASVEDIAAVPGLTRSLRSA